MPLCGEVVVVQFARRIAELVLKILAKDFASESNCRRMRETSRGIAMFEEMFFSKRLF